MKVLASMGICAAREKSKQLGQSKRQFCTRDGVDPSADAVPLSQKLVSKQNQFKVEFIKENILKDPSIARRKQDEKD